MKAYRLLILNKQGVLHNDQKSFSDNVFQAYQLLEKEHGKPITHDTWSQALEFSRQIGVDMRGYDPAGAWPYLIDEFVEHMMAAKEVNEGGGD